MLAITGTLGIVLEEECGEKVDLRARLWEVLLVSLPALDPEFDLD